MLTTLIFVVIVLVIVGVADYFVQRSRIAPGFKLTIRAVMVIGLLVWLLYLTAGWTGYR